MSDQTTGAADHFAPWVQGDAADSRMQLFRQLKLDRGVVPAAGIPIIWKNPGWVIGLLTAAGLADGSVTSAKILDGTITNIDIAAAAAIVYSKLNLNNSIVGTDIVNGSIGGQFGNLKIAAATVGATDIAAGQVGGNLGNGKIQGASIGNADIAAAAAIDFFKMTTAPTAWLNGSGTVMTTGVTTAVVFTNVQLNNALYYSAVAGAGITVSRTGKYLLSAGCLFPGAAVPAGLRTINILVAGVTVATWNMMCVTTASTATSMNGSITVPITATQQITMTVQHQQGGTLTLTNVINNYLQATFVGL